MANSREKMSLGVPKSDLWKSFWCPVSPCGPLWAAICGNCGGICSPRAFTYDFDRVCMPGPTPGIIRRQKPGASRPLRHHLASPRKVSPREDVHRSKTAVAWPHP